MAFEEQYTHIRCQVRCQYGGEGAQASMKILKKIKLVGFVSGAQLCHNHRINATTNFFLFKKRMAQDSLKCSVSHLIAII